jgi:asparagine synthase (glutamine-hydrolysing)
MCGLVGYFGSKNCDLAAAAAEILHRGPDMQGISGGKGWRIAFNRLSIIDVTDSGMQPFLFDGVTVVMNGEIYNYRELIAEHQREYTCRSGSDVEIVPFLYRKYGLRFLHKLNGMFAMALMDDASGKCYLIRDRFGKKPLFYHDAGERIYFASELKALRKIVALQPDRTNLALNMACWLLIQPLTLYERTFNVNPGHYLEFDGSRSVERRWYEPYVEAREQTYEQIRDRFLALYRQSIGLRLRSDVPIGISLSGGLDSSSMAFVARDICPENFHAFTASIADKESFEGPTDTENPRRLCQQLGIPQIGTSVDADFWDANIVDIAHNYEEVFLNSGTLVFYAIAAAARARGVKVLLSGVGGDELFGGYPWQAQMRRLPVAHLRAAMRGVSTRGAKRAHRLILGLRPERLAAKLARGYRLSGQFHLWHAQSLSSTLVPHLRDVERSVAERIETYSEYYFRLASEAVHGDPYNQVHYANVFTVIGNQNYQFDMASMRHSVENRSPLLDVNVVEYMMSVPDRVKNSTGPKSLMRRILAEFLPHYITHASKSGPTMPLERWFCRGERARDVRRFLERHRDLVGELVSTDLAARMRDDTFYRGAPGAMRLFALVSLVLWARINVQGSISDPHISFSDLVRASA